MNHAKNIMNKINNLIKSPWILLYLIFIEGFVSVAVEILLIRQLTPFVGTSVIVTSIIIGIFLLFLAIGYWRGGLYRSDFYHVLSRNFIWSMIFIGVGLAYPFIEVFFYAGLFGQATLIALVVYLLLIVSPLVYFLGQTIPLTMNLVKQENVTGATGGKVLFLSTVGSFFGAILTTLLLIEFFGVAWSIFVNFCLILSLVLLLPKQFKYYLYLALIPALVVLVFMINVAFEQRHFVLTTNYANYEVQNDIAADGAFGKILKINNSRSSFLDSNKRAFPYIELIKRVLFQDLGLRHKNILVIGAGGFTLSAENDYDNHFTYVDIDKQVYSVTRQHFLKEIKGDFIAVDAEVYLNKNNQPYDVIVSDVYTNVNTIPAELMTIEYLRHIKDNLISNGIAIFNIVARPFLDDPYSKRVDSTIRTIFKNCMAIPVNYHQDLTNIIYLCKKATNENDPTIYSEDKSTLTLDFFRKGS